MGKLDGHCLCGGVTLSCDADPLAVANCHCSDCQHQTGSVFSTVVAVPRGTVTLTGDSLASFETVGSDHGQPVERSFCSACGSPLLTNSAAAPQMSFIKVGVVEDKTGLTPQLDVWTESAHEWALVGVERNTMPRGLPA